MRNRIALACVSSFFLAATACGGGDDSSVPPDAAGDATSAQDAAKDSGTVPTDAHADSATDAADATADATADAANENADATVGVGDAGADAQDATTSELDAALDAGADVEDASSVVDAGPVILDAGPRDLDASLGYCGTWLQIAASTSVASVGDTLTLSATGAAPDPSSLGYTWTQSTADGGTIGAIGTTSDESVGASEATSFLCTSPGTATITLTVDDGPVPDGGAACPTSFTTGAIEITCNAVAATEVESAWVEIGSTGSATSDGGSIVGTNTVIARAITAAPTCPTITLNGGSPQAMDVRVAAGTIPLRVTTSTSLGPQFSKPSVFPVTTCELVLPSGTTSATVNANGGIALPLPKAQAQTIVVIGDTGCRMQYGANNTSQWQDCSDPTQYTFAATAQAAAKFHPDVVVHVGDYQYRDNECPPDMAGCAGSPWGYGWDTWQADFFRPAQPLLAAAPWVVNRGNHESCTRAGQGWYRFLDPNGYDSVPNKDCNVQGAAVASTSGGGFVGDNIGGYSTPYAVQLRDDTQVFVFDTSNIAKTAIAPTGANGNMFSAYQTELLQMGALPKPDTFNIWTNHHAILGFANSPPVASPGVALLSVMESVYPDTLFPPGTNMALHGHTHLFEAVDYTPSESDAGVPNDYPATFVSGNAGTLLDTDLPTPFTPGLSPAPEAGVPPQVANIAHSPDFGFLVMQYQPADAGAGATWLMTEYKQDGVTIQTQCVAQMSGQTSCTNWGELP